MHCKGQRAISNMPLTNSALTLGDSSELGWRRSPQKQNNNKKKSFVVFLIPRYLPAGGGAVAHLFQLPVQHISRPQGWLIKQMCVGVKARRKMPPLQGFGSEIKETVTNLQRPAAAKSVKNIKLGMRQRPRAPRSSLQR